MQINNQPRKPGESVNEKSLNSFEIFSSVQFTLPYPNPNPEADSLMQLLINEISHTFQIFSKLDQIIQDHSVYYRNLELENVQSLENFLKDERYKTIIHDANNLLMLLQMAQNKMEDFAFHIANIVKKSTKNLASLTDSVTEIFKHPPNIIKTKISQECIQSVFNQQNLALELENELNATIESLSHSVFQVTTDYSLYSEKFGKQYMSYLQYLIENLQAERDDLRETTRLLKNFVVNQKNMIVALNSEINRLSSTGDSIKEVALSNKENLRSLFDPYREVCQKYSQELKNGVRCLEQLLLASRMEVHGHLITCDDKEAPIKQQIELIDPPSSIESKKLLKSLNNVGNRLGKCISELMMQNCASEIFNEDFDDDGLNQNNATGQGVADKSNCCQSNEVCIKVAQELAMLKLQIEQYLVETLSPESEI